jgi:hypothetical protein
MTFGALAIQEDEPTLAKEIIERAFASLPISMEAYQPDGVYPEGYGYWGYGSSFNILFLSAVEKALGSTFEKSGWLNRPSSSKGPPSRTRCLNSNG